MPSLPQGDLQAQVAHDRAHHRALQRAGLLPRAGDDVQQLVAVEHATQVVDHHQPVAVAVQRNAHGGAHARHGQLQQFRRRRAAAIVDVAAIGRAADGDDVGAEVGQQPRPDLVAGAVGAVDHDLHAGQVQAARHAGRAERLVVLAQCIGAARATQAIGFLREHAAFHLRLDALLEFVGKLGAAGVEELDAVVFVGIVRSADHDAEGARQRASSGRRCPAWAADRSACTSTPAATNPASSADSNR